MLRLPPHGVIANDPLALETKRREAPSQADRRPTAGGPGQRCASSVDDKGWHFMRRRRRTLLTSPG